MISKFPYRRGVAGVVAEDPRGGGGRRKIARHGGGGVIAQCDRSGADDAMLTMPPEAVGFEAIGAVGERELAGLIGA